uniref:Peptidase S1 domain-containing protein n=1 Tax=Onchocerca flexuosa TaxID=387005 RepID=A0A183H882_9BILA
LLVIYRAQYGRFFRQRCCGGDIALLELEHEIDEKDANYICLANRILLSENEKFYTIQAVGWGSNPTVKRIFMNNLQKLEFHRLIDRDKCKQIYGKLLSNDILCTEEAYSRNVCLGDSGGGLMAQLHDGRWLLLGISSYGTSCKKLADKAAQPLVQVYTDIRMYSGEIDKFTGYFLPWEQV